MSRWCSRRRRVLALLRFRLRALGHPLLAARRRAQLPLGQLTPCEVGQRLRRFQRYLSSVTIKSAYATIECSGPPKFSRKAFWSCIRGDGSLHCIEKRLSLHLGSISPKQHEHSSDQV